MSKLDELIKRLCPDGVEYRKISEITNYEQPTKYIVSSTKYDNCFKTPVLTAGQSFILGYTNETDGIYAASEEKPVIIFDDFTASFKWVDFPFKVKSSAMKIITVNQQVTTMRYLYHIMGHLNFSSNEHKRLWIATYSELYIPVPPFEVQHEIVRILDNFTELTAELTAELAARNKQYEYYRDKLLSFDSPLPFIKEMMQEYCPNGVEYYELGNLEDLGLLSLGRGNVISKQEIQTNPGKYPVYSSSATGDGQIGTYGKYMFSDERITWSIDGGGKLFYRNGTKYSVTNVGGWISVNNKKKLNTKYLYYSLISQWQTKTFNYIHKAHPSVIRTEYMVPVPPIQIQEKIVQILDNFSTLCSDISTGLPAEIEARKKQYEYYRDKLLTFEEKETA